MSQPTTIRRHGKAGGTALLLLLAGSAWLLSKLPGTPVAGSTKPTPEQRALAYLNVEVPRWHAENHCYSCHNNGDGARAMLAGKKAGFIVPEASLADTQLWLDQPENWDHNGGEGGFSDKVLARLQFARTLAEATPRESVPAQN